MVRRWVEALQILVQFQFLTPYGMALTLVSQDGL